MTAFGSLNIMHPSFMIPELAVQISQRSGAFGLLPDNRQDVRLSTNDLYVYLRKIEVRTSMGVAQAAKNRLEAPQFATTLAGTPTYMMQSRVEYNHHDTAAASVWNVALPDAYRKAVWQTFAQNERNALLYGFNAANGEGILNTSGITNVTLPPDSNGNTTFSTYDNGQFGFWLSQLVVALQIRQFLSAQGGNRIVICGPQRILAPMEKSNIVQLTQYQRVGAGVATTGEMIKRIFQDAGDSIDYRYDDTLIGQGQGGTDAIIIAAPELEDQEDMEGPNTNNFQGIQPNYKHNIDMFADMTAPREITVPLPGGYTDVTFEKRISPGWVIRGEAVTVASVQYQ